MGYFWFYKQGLIHRNLSDVCAECVASGKPVKQKYLDNYWRGWNNSMLYGGQEDPFAQASVIPQEHRAIYKEYMDYPQAAMVPEPAQRWVPCSESNKPLIKWGRGCMTKADAMVQPHQKYLAENLKGCRHIVIDIDGDHGGSDLDVVRYFSKYKDKTLCHEKPMDGECLSYHLTFTVDKVIPTMHFPEAHLDICGNAGNQLRYFKNKVSNNRQPMRMTQEVWEDIWNFIERRRQWE